MWKKKAGKKVSNHLHLHLKCKMIALQHKMEADKSKSIHSLILQLGNFKLSIIFPSAVGQLKNGCKVSKRHQLNNLLKDLLKDEIVESNTVTNPDYICIIYDTIMEKVSILQIRIRTMNIETELAATKKSTKL